MDVFDANGKPVRLGKIIGRGGEAVVYETLNKPGWLAKIYEPAPRRSYPDKLAWMMEHRPENPTRSYKHASLAWPTALLYGADRSLAGYIMPHIQNAVPILEVFNPKRRAKTLPGFDRRYLHRAARNLAATLGAVHRAGYVVGDLNESNVLVTQSALVTLIDTDSFQVEKREKGRMVVHPCPVAKLEYTPPELHGQSVGSVVRQPEHDAFGLGVLIFQLLMDGNHPFRAQWLGSGDPPPIEIRISQGIFPYTAASSAAKVQPPKNAPGLNVLYPRIGDLMRLCFIEGYQDPKLRPTPAQWEVIIAEAEKALVQCLNGHIYSNHLRYCPYCPASERTKSSIARPVSVSSRPQSQTIQTPRQTGIGLPGWAKASRAVRKAPQPAPAHTASSQPAVQPSRTAPATQSNAPAQARPWNGPFAWPRWPQSAQWGRGGSIFRSPANPQRQPSRSTHPSRPIVQQKGKLWDWVRPLIYRSAGIGAGYGALAGLLPGALTSFAAGSLEYHLSWSLLWAIGGVGGGMARGWKPGYNTGLWINRYVGWRRFWKAAGAVSGGITGFLIGLLFAWAIFPLFAGPIAGGKLGMALGERLWLATNRYGWERIWAVVVAVTNALVGAGLAWLAGFTIPGIASLQLLNPLDAWLLEETGSQIVVWLAFGGLAGAFGGAVSGFVADLVARLTRLID
jgi:serine/threonine protein kinase